MYTNIEDIDIEFNCTIKKVIDESVCDDIVYDAFVLVESKEGILRIRDGCLQIPPNTIGLKAKMKLILGSLESKSATIVEMKNNKEKMDMEKNQSHLYVIVKQLMDDSMILSSGYNTFFSYFKKRRRPDNINVNDVFLLNRCYFYLEYVTWPR